MSFIAQITEQFDRQIKAFEGSSRFMRESAWDAFIRRGLPTRRVENWRYTSLRILDQLSTETVQESISVKSLLAGIPENMYRIVMVDGVLHPDLTDYEVRLSSDSIPAQISPDKHPMAVLNLALFQDGLEIVIPENHVIDKPIALVHVSTKNSAGKSHCVNIRLKLEKGSRATLISHYYSTGLVPHSNNVLVQASLQQNARLDYATVNFAEQAGVAIEGFHAEQEAGSSFNAFVLSKGTKVSRTDFTTTYLGPQAQAKMIGMYLASGQQHLDIHLNAEHLAAHCSTFQSVRGVVDGQSKVVFNGRVCVHKDAVKSYSEQANHNLIMSANAEVYTKPELEIYNDDVKCAHGATVGQLDQEALFYLKSRGIDEPTALEILRRAFIEQQFDAVDDQTLRDYLRGLL